MTVQDSDLVLFINTLRWEATFGSETVASYAKSRSLQKSIVESKVGSPMWPGLIIHACFAQYQQVDMLTTAHGPQVVQVTCRLLCMNYMCTESILNLVSLF